MHNELTGKKVDKVGRFKYLNYQNNCEHRNSLNSFSKDLSTQRNNSIISSIIHGKTSKKVRCLNCNYNYPSSEEDFTSLLLHIPSNKEITVHLKFYLAEPIDGNIMYDYELKFDSCESCIFEACSKIQTSKSEDFLYEYYTSTTSAGVLKLVDASTKIKDLGKIENSELEIIIHLYELKYLPEDCDYYDFKLCTGEKFRSNSKPTGSVFKIEINQNATMLDFHRTVCWHLFPDKRTSSETEFETFFNKKTNSYWDQEYRIDFDCQVLSLSSCPLKNNSYSHLCEVGRSESSTFGDFLKQIKKDKDNLIKPSFKIVRIKSSYDSMKSLETNKASQKQKEAQPERILDINSILSNFISDEFCSDFSCSNCKSQAQCATNTTLLELPQYLIIRLMRFQIDDSYTRQMYMKNEEFIDYPLKDLDLSKYCDPNAKLDNCKYDLYGVIHHTGSVEFGHYYATIKNDIDSDKWFMFNDEYVEQCTKENVVILEITNWTAE